MILKYKSGNNAWVYKHIGDVTIGKADISEVISKYIDKNTGKININKDNFSNALIDIYEVFRKVIGSISYSHTVESTKELMKYTQYVLAKENDNVLYITSEAYLMSDNGKTIERLL